MHAWPKQQQRDAVRRNKHSVAKPATTCTPAARGSGRAVRPAARSRGGAPHPPAEPPAAHMAAGKEHGSEVQLRQRVYGCVCAECLLMGNCSHTQRALWRTVW